MTDGFLSPLAPRFVGTAWLLGAVRAQRSMWAETFCHWTRRPLPSARYARHLGDGQRFEQQRGSWLSVLVPMVVFAQCVDVLICQAALQIAVQDVVLRWVGHGLLLFVSLWSVVWAVSLRSATRHVDHVLGPHAITLAVGFRDLCRIPLAAVASARVIDHRVRRPGDDWFDVHGLKPRDVTLLTALDKPTLLIELHPGPQDAGWSRNGVHRPLRRWVAVHVDQANAMAAAIAAAAPPSSTSSA